MKSERYRYIEKILYEYQSKKEEKDAYTSELEEMTEHGDVKVQDYQPSMSGGEVSDRVLDYVHRKQVLERKLMRLTMEVSAVDKVCHQIDLRGDDHAVKLYAVLQGVYFGGGDVIPYVLGLEGQEVQSLRHELVRLVDRELRIYQKGMRYNA